MRAIVFALLLMLASATTAIAQTDSVNDFLKLYEKSVEEGDNTLPVFIAGIRQALDAANGALDFRADRKLYCKPDELFFTTDQIVSFVKQARQRNPTTGEWNQAHISTLLLLELQRLFPCE